VKENTTELVVMAQGASRIRSTPRADTGPLLTSKAPTFREASTAFTVSRRRPGRISSTPRDPPCSAGAGTLALEIEEDVPDADG